MKTFTFFLPFYLVLASCSAVSCTNSNSIAKLGSFEVDTLAFKSAFNSFYYQTGRSIPINSYTKKQVLESELNKLALIQYAYDTGLAERSDLLFEKERIHQKALINRVIDRLYIDTLNVTQTEVRQLFYDFNTYVRASHLYAETQNEAVELLYRLQKGESFSELALEVFDNPYLAKNGGDLGYFTVDEMDISLEKAAYRSKKNEVIGPIKTAQGYSILKVTDRQVRPLITETEFLTQKARFESFAREQKTRLFLRQYAQNFANDLEISPEYLQSLERNFPENNLAVMFTEEWEIPVPQTETDVRYKDETIDPIWIQRAINFRSENELSAISTKEQYFDLIYGFLFRAYHLAKSESLSSKDLDYVQESVETTWRSKLQSEVRDQLLIDLVIPEDSLVAFYNQEPSLFDRPLTLRLQRIRLRSEVQAKDVLEKLRGGLSFSDAVLNYSGFNEDLMISGEIGWTRIDELGTLATHLKQIQENELSDLIQYQAGEWHIYKCLGRKESTPQSFSEAKDEVEGVLLSIWHRKEVAELVTEIKAKHNVQIDTQILSNINFSHLK